MTFTEVFVEPVANALEDIFLVVIVVPRAIHHLNPACTGIVVGGIEQHAMPVYAGFVILFARIPVNIQNIKQANAGFFLLFSNLHDKVFKPAIIAIRSLGAILFIVRRDGTPLPFIGGYRSCKLDIFPHGTSLLGNINIAFYQEISRNRQVEVRMRAAPNINFVVHAPVLQSVHVVLEFIPPIRDNSYSRIGWPRFVVKFVIAGLDKRLSIIGNFAATSKIKCVLGVLAVFLIPVPIAKIIIAGTCSPPRKLECIHGIHFRHLV